MLGARLGGCLRGVRAACLYHLSVDFNVAKTLGVDGEVGVKALVLRKAAAEVIPVVVRGQRCPVPVEPVSVAKPLVPLVVLALVHAALHAPQVLKVRVPAGLVPLAKGVRGVLALVILAHIVAETHKVVVHARLPGAARVPRALVEAAHNVALDKVVGVAAVLRGAARRQALVHRALHAVVVDLLRKLDLVALHVAREESNHTVSRGIPALLLTFGVLERVGVHALLLGQAHVALPAVVLLANHFGAVHLQPVHVLAPPVAADPGVQPALVEPANLAEGAPMEEEGKTPFAPTSLLLAVLSRVPNQVVVVAPHPRVVHGKAHFEVSLRHAVQVVFADFAHSPIVTRAKRVVGHARAHVRLGCPALHIADDRKVGVAARHGPLVALPRHHPPLCVILAVVPHETLVAVTVVAKLVRHGALVHAALHPAELRHVVVAAVGRRIGASHPAGRLILALVQHHAAPAVLLTPVVAHALARVVVGHKLRPLDAHLVGHAQRGVLLALVDRHVAHKVANHHKVGVVARRGVAARHLVTLVGPALHVTEHPHVGVAAAPAMGAAKLDALVLLALVVVGVVALKGHHPALPARQHPALGVAAKVVAGIGRTLNPIPVHIMAPRDVEWIVVLAHAHSLWAVELVRNLVNGDKTNRQLPVLLKVVAQVHRVVALIIVAQLAGVPRLHGKVGVQALPVAADAIVLYALVHPAAHDSHLVGA
mmetsp:Transcript_28470/g.66363  ORF Transcript_28470/g.66363 Transcript_28470/m.66363 type:complete len:709 (+) Transcript_28470:1376-3502(+)